MTTVAAFTFLTESNIKVSSYATSGLELDAQHFASSKLEPSLDVRILTWPGAYAQSILRPRGERANLNEAMTAELAGQWIAHACLGTSSPADPRQRVLHSRYQSKSHLKESRGAGAK